MGRKKKSAGAGEMAQGSGKNATPMSSSSSKIVGAEYIETNGTVTHPGDQEKVVPVVPVPVESGAELVEKSQQFWKGMTKNKI